MSLNVNDLVIIEMIMIDHRYSDIREFFGDDEQRLSIVNGIVRYVLRRANHESEFQTYVNIKLDELEREMND